MIPSPLQEALRLVGSGQNLSATQCGDAVAAILRGDAEPAAIGAFLTALHLKGISADELSGALTAVIDRSEAFPLSNTLRPVLDTCGTGGDGANSVNISTATAIVVAACGVRVAKHGNRSASGNSGSAEVLAELGVKFDAEPLVLLRCLEEVGITFLFAPRFHPALKGLAPIRKALPHRTIFNAIGPLVNPVRPDAQVVGVAGRAQALLLSSVLRRTSTGPQVAEHARRHELEKQSSTDFFWVDNDAASDFRSFVVCGEDGLDEVTLAGATTVFATVGPTRSEHAWRPCDFGLPTIAATELVVSGPADSSVKILDMLAGGRGPVRDVVLANSAAALMLVGKVDNLLDGVARAAESIDRGDAARLLDRWAKLSHSR